MISISEYSHLARAECGPTSAPAQCGQEPATARQILHSGDVSAPFSDTTAFIRVVSDTDVMIDIGHAPDAARRGMLLMGGAAEFFGVRDGHRLGSYGEEPT